MSKALKKRSVYCKSFISRKRSRRFSDRCLDQAGGYRGASGNSGEIINTFGCCGRGSVAADPQRRHHRRQCLSAAVLLVLSLVELQLSAQGRAGLLYGDRRWTISRDSRRWTQLHRTSVGYRACIGCAECASEDCGTGGGKENSLGKILCPAGCGL